jgi:hypothetical protein
MLIKTKQGEERMKKMLIVLFLVLMSTALLGETWTHSETLMDFRVDTTGLSFEGEISGEVRRCSQPHGVAVTADGKIWVAFHNTYGANDDGVHEFQYGEDVSYYRPLYVFNPDGTIYKRFYEFELPDGTIDTLHSQSVDNGAGKGINLDGNGDILYSSFAAVYRIDAETHECTGKFTNPLVTTATNCAHDPVTDLYFVGAVGGGNPIWMLDGDFEYLKEAVPSHDNINRTVAVRSTDDATDLYTGSTWNGNGVFHYQALDPEFEDFEIADTLGNLDEYQTEDTTYYDVKLWAESINWDNEGNLIVGTIRPTWGGPLGPYWWILDVDNNELLSKFGVPVPDSIVSDDLAGGPFQPEYAYQDPGGANGPRGACMVDDNTLYTTDFYLYTIEKWTAEANSVRDIASPASFELKQNYPNPLNPTTTIEYSIQKDANVVVSIFNMKGQLIETLVNEHQSSGTHQVQWDAKGMASGTYLYKVQVGDEALTRKMVLLK